MRRCFGVLLALLTVFFWSMDWVRSESPSDDLNKKLDALMKRLDEQEKIIKSQGEKIKQQEEIIESLKKQTGGSDVLTPKQEKQVEQLVSQYLRKEENRISLGLEGLTAGYKDGFFLATRDQSYKLKFTGYMQIDGRFPEDTSPTAETFMIRRARPTIEGTLGKYYHFKVQPDFGEGKTVLKDAYIDLAYFGDLFTTRLGKFKVPQGLEQLTSSSNILFVERSLMTNIAPDRDIGVMAYGKPWGPIFEYTFGVWNGNERADWQGKGKDSGVDNSDRKDFGGRIQLSPFANTDNFWIKGLQMGGWFNYGQEEDVPAAGKDGILSYKTAAGTTFFKTGKDVRQDGDRLRAGWDVAWTWGPVMFVSEWQVMNSELFNPALPAARRQANVDTQAWAVQASWLLTGEDATLKGVKPKKDFDPKKGGWGAWELAARYARLEVDDKMFQGFASKTGQANSAGELTLGLNWYLNKNVKLMFNWVKTNFDDPVAVKSVSGATTKVTQITEEDAFMFRTQVKW